MKRVIAAAMSLSLLSLSAGPWAPGVAAQTVAAAGVPVRTPAAPVAGLPSFDMGLRNAPAPAPGLLSAPGTVVLTLPTLRTAPVASALLSPVAPGSPAAPAPVAPSARATPLLQPAFVSPEGEATPFAQSLQALAAPAPDYKDADAGESRGMAEKDFQTRTGQGSIVEGAGSEVAFPEVDLIVSAPEGSALRLTRDVYPAYLSPKTSVRDLELAMAGQLSHLGISPELLSAHGATALGAVAQINTAVVRVPGREASPLADELKALGLSVRVGRTFELPRPLESEPTAKTVGLKEMGKVIGADKLQAELAKALGEPTPPAPGKPEPGFVARAAAWVGSTVKRVLFGVVENPVLPWAVLDSWSDVNHPYLKGRFVKSVANDNDGESHGTHTAGTVVGMDRWNYHGRNYNIFPNGSATEGDILFKLNMAQQDGALATTNSWGDNSGNPEGAIEKLFVKTAEAGMHHSVSAGNSGYYGKNSIGGPAIVYHLADLVINGKVVGQVKRIKAIAASDADKKTASFSSRGPGSRTTSRDPEHYKDYPQKPDESGVGVNLVAPVPSGSVVPELGGPGAAMSGTSMSNPGVFGGFMLLTRAVLVLLKDALPALPGTQVTQFAMDLARYAMTRTAEKVAGPDEVGDGFVNVWSAYEYAAKLLKDNAPVPAKAALRFHSFMRGLFGF
ncbi:MAG: S8 family serine peptidase [Elusimicrobia bacterium]|nr:S8 family serine peptidase [Elusimicrobiota bacterium]